MTEPTTDPTPEVMSLQATAQPSADDAPRPMTGLFASLTPEQQAAALAYRGPDDLPFKPSADDVTGQSRSEWAAVNVARERQREAGAEMLTKLKQHLASSADDVERAREIADQWLKDNIGWASELEDLAYASIGLRDNLVKLIFATRAQGIAQGRAGMREEAAQYLDKVAVEPGAEFDAVTVEHLADDIRAIPIDTPTGHREPSR